jgi:hypothetical protein
MDLADRQSYVEQFKEELAFMQEQTKTDVTTQEGEQV